MRKTRGLLLAAGLACCLLIACAAGVRAQPAAESEAALADARRPEYKGPLSCGDCHDRLNERRTAEFIQQDEWDLFQSEDRHRLAYELLDSERGRQITDALRLGRNDRRCLSCHANWRADDLGLATGPPPGFAMGVTCESCHGPSSHWEAEHDESNWRKRSVAEKEALGLVDVRNPVVRAEQCFSCHIGNTDQAKFVTHEMYAAGHPPLPGIELATFVEEMPPHWRTLREKGAFEFRQEFIAAARDSGQYDPTEELPRTKAVLIGTVVALRESVELVVKQAEARTTEAVTPGQASAPAPPGGADSTQPAELDLALFDCQACHHDLRADRSSDGPWRQRRNAAGLPPGSPYPAIWLTSLVEAVIEVLGPEDGEQSLRGDLDQFQSTLSLGRLDMGQRERIKTAGGHLISRLDKLAAQLARQNIDAASARRALDSLCRLDATTWPDFHAARHTVWAIETIHVELQSGYCTFQEEPEGQESFAARQARARRDLDVFFGHVERRRMHREATAALFERLELTSRLALELPNGREPNALESGLANTLNAIAAYDPDWFARQVQALRREIAPQRPSDGGDGGESAPMGASGR